MSYAFRHNEDSKRRKTRHMSESQLKYFEECEAKLPTVEDALQELESQGWRCGPALLRESALAIPSRRPMTEYGFGIIPQECVLWTWRAAIITEVWFERRENLLSVMEIKLHGYSNFFHIFNIELDPHYVFQTVQNLVDEKYGGIKIPIGCHQRGLTLEFPFQILPQPGTHELSWIIDDHGQIWRYSIDSEGKTHDQTGRFLWDWGESFYAHLNTLKNLRPIFVHFVLRYLMLAHDCDVPILEAVFERWHGADYKGKPDQRLFQMAHLPKEYRKKGILWSDEIEVVY
jgi:hypothetical protein